MRYDFNDKVIWITGASSGIGEALAYAMSNRGAKLILSSRREDELERVRLACGNPDRVKVVPLDLMDSSMFGAKTAEAIAAFGQIDMMIHNGGVSQRGLAIETSMEVQRRVMELDGSGEGDNGAGFRGVRSSGLGMPGACFIGYDAPAGRAQIRVGPPVLRHLVRNRRPALRR